MPKAFRPALGGALVLGIGLAVASCDDANAVIVYGPALFDGSVPIGDGGGAAMSGGSNGGVPSGGKATGGAPATGNGGAGGAGGRAGAAGTSGGAAGGGA